MVMVAIIIIIIVADNFKKCLIKGQDFPILFRDPQKLFNEFSVKKKAV